MSSAEVLSGSNHDEVMVMPVTPATTSTEPGDYRHSNGSHSGKNVNQATSPEARITPAATKSEMVGRSARPHRAAWIDLG